MTNQAEGETKKKPSCTTAKQRSKSLQIIARSERDGTCAETRFGLSTKRTSPFQSAGASVQSTTGSRGARISGSNGSNAGYTMFCGTVQDCWLPTQLVCFPYISPTVRHRVPSGFNWALLHTHIDCHVMDSFYFSMWAPLHECSLQLHSSAIYATQSSQILASSSPQGTGNDYANYIQERIAVLTVFSRAHNKSLNCWVFRLIQPASECRTGQKSYKFRHDISVSNLRLKDIR